MNGVSSVPIIGITRAITVEFIIMISPFSTGPSCLDQSGALAETPGPVHTGAPS